MKAYIIQNKFQEKPLFLLVDLHVNSLDYSRSTHVCDFFNFVFQNVVWFLFQSNQIDCNSNGSYPNKIYNRLQSSIIKTDISDHFAVSSLIKTNLKQTNIWKIIIKRDINEDSMKYFETIFNGTDWDLLTQTSSTNDSNNILLQRFI